MIFLYLVLQPDLTFFGQELCLMKNLNELFDKAIFFFVKIFDTFYFMIRTQLGITRLKQFSKLFHFRGANGKIKEFALFRTARSQNKHVGKLHTG